MTASLRRLLWAVLIAAAACAASGRAGAHAVLEDSLPQDRAVLARQPAAIVLRFNEPVTPIALRLLTASGKPVALGPPRAVDNDVRASLPIGLPDGVYIVSWRATSADSHPVGGAFLFAVGAPPADWRTDAMPGTHEAFWDSAIIVNHALFLAGLLLSVGGFLYLLLAERRGDEAWAALRPVTTPSAILALAAAALAVGLQGGALADLAPSSLATVDPWRIGMESTRGPASLLAIAAMALLTVGLGGGSGFRRWLGAAGAVCGVASMALTGHAAVTPPRWLFILLVLLHVAIAAFWIGSLPGLRRTIAARPAAAIGPVRRFSRLAIIGVPMLIPAGLGMALIQVASWSGLTDGNTPYGALLLAKLALVAVLVGLAGWNRMVLTPALARGEASAGRRLRSTIGIELAVALAILAVTAALSQSVPPRALAGIAAHHGAAPPGFSTYIRSHGLAAIIEVAPARAGRRNGIAVGIVDDNGRRVAPLEVTVELSNPSLGIEPIVRKMTPTPGGGFSYVGPEFAAPGTWRLRVDALITDFDKLVFETEVPIRPAAGADR